MTNLDVPLRDFAASGELHVDGEPPVRPGREARQHLWNHRGPAGGNSGRRPCDALHPVGRAQYTAGIGMIDAEKQIVYWREGAGEDRIVARELLDRGHTRHALFFCHLALEKALKAHVCRRTRDLAPRIHNLTRLAEFAGVDLPGSYRDVLADMNAFNIEGRYPDLLLPPPSKTEARLYASRAEEVLEWLLSQL